MTSGVRHGHQSEGPYAMRPMAIKISTDVEVMGATPSSFDNKISDDSELTPYPSNPSNVV